MSRVFWSILLLPLLASPAAPAADATNAHPHQGLLKPYPRPPPPLLLSDAEKQLLEQGKPAMRLAEGSAGGRGMAIFVVQAPPEVTWGVITDFKAYPKWIKEVKSIDVYRRQGGKIDVAFKVESFPVTVEYFIHHDYDLANRWGTWTLDYARESDLNDSVGFWRVNPVEGKPGQSVVEYSIDIAIKGWVPGFVREMLVDDGLKTATSWVKVQSERRAQAAPASAPPSTPAAQGAAQPGR